MSKLQNSQKTNPKTLSIPLNLHKYQDLVFKSNARFKVVGAGRKWGKTTLAVRMAFDYLGKPNAMVWWVAPYQEVAAIGWRRFLAIIPHLIIKEIHRKEHYIEMINNSTIFFKTADSPDSLIGEGIDLMILDEAARIREKTWLETLRPNLDDPARTGHAVMISTPRAHNWFYAAFLEGLKKERRGTWEAWTYPYQNMEGGFPSWTNPHMRVSDLAEAKELPEKVFLQEYACRFLEDLGNVFKGIRGAIAGDLEDPMDGVEYVAGVDWGKTGSNTVVTILDTSGHLDAYDCFKLPSWNMQINRVASLLKEYKPHTIVDSTGFGDPLYEMLYREYSDVTPVTLTQPRKADIIENLALMIESKKITYPEIPELIYELAAFGVEQSAHGISYRAPPGFMDDFVISLGMAAWQLRESPVEPGFEFFDVTIPIT